jgi:chromosome segregation ATPase
MKNLAPFAAIILGIAAVALWLGMSNAKKAVTTLETDRASLTNKLQSLTSASQEKDAAIETLRTTGKLDAEDRASLSNKIVSLNAELTGARRVSKEKESAIAMANAELRKAEAEIGALKGRVASLDAELAAASKGVASADVQLAQLRQELENVSADRNTSERLRNDMLRQWSDVAAVRAQYKSLTNPKFGPAPSIYTKNRPVLELEADGTVTATPRDGKFSKM